LSGLGLSPTREAEIVDELSQHLEDRYRELLSGGASPEEARRLALAEFKKGNVLAEHLAPLRQANVPPVIPPGAATGHVLTDLWQDARHGMRMLTRRPGFAVAATLTLALGIGATATVFALLDVVLFRPLPVSDPGALAHLYTSCQRGDVYCVSSYPEFVDYQAQSRTFADMATFTPIELSLGDGSARWVGRGLLVSTTYFSMLGVAPHEGALFTPTSDVQGDPPLVLSYEAWSSRFGGSPQAIGQLVNVSGARFRIVGVAPPEFRGTRLADRPDFWIPIENYQLLPTGIARPGTLTDRSTRWISGIVGRLRQGQTIAQAQEDMRAISDGLQTSDSTRDGRFITVEPARQAALPPEAAADIRRFVALLMGGVAATLLIACANIAGLQLARGAARRPELELRRALGARRGRLVRQLLTEYMWLALLGTVGGLLIARWAMSFLAGYDLPGGVSVGSLDLGLDARVLACAFVLLAVTGAFGLLPALGITRGMSATTGSRTAGEGAGRVRPQRVLVGVQAAVTLVLLIAAGLFIRSLQNGLTLDLGLTRGPVVMAYAAPALEGYPPSRARSVLSEAIERLAAMPGVTAASVARVPPLTTGSGFSAQLIGGYSPAPGESMRFEANFVGPDYFRTLGIRIKAGREFTTADREGAPLVGVVSETMARRFWSGRDPIGGRITSRSFPAPIDIVGVSRDVAVGLDGTAEPFVYLPFHQHLRFVVTTRPMVLFVRTESNPSPVAASIRPVLQEIDPSLPVTEVTTLDARVGDLLMPQRFGATLLSTMAALTLVLVAVGVVGTVGYEISRRRREIGIRLALGATRRQVVLAMIQSTLLPVAAGVVAGVAAALAFGSLASSFLYGITPTDVVTLGSAAAVLAACAGVASFVPAWRAAGADPSEVLRAE
jgi:predicted permease